MRCLAAAALASALAAAAAAPEGQHVVEIVGPDQARLPCARDTVLRVAVRVKPGYHVQANPVLDPALIPITLAIAAPAWLEAGPPRYPPPKRLRLRGAEDELVVLDGHFAIEVSVRAARAPSPAQATLSGALRYQACDDERCLFPRTLPLAISVRTDGECASARSAGAMRP